MRAWQSISCYCRLITPTPTRTNTPLLVLILLRFSQSTTVLYSDDSTIYEYELLRRLLLRLLVLLSTTKVVFDFCYWVPHSDCCWLRLVWLRLSESSQQQCHQRQIQQSPKTFHKNKSSSNETTHENKSINATTHESKSVETTYESTPTRANNTTITTVQNNKNKSSSRVDIPLNY